MTTSSAALFRATKHTPAVDHRQAEIADLPQIRRERTARSNRGSGKGLRFLELAVTSATDDCIPWPFYCMANGYGQVGDHGGMRLAHRVLCEMAHGPALFDGAQAAHSCANRSCVNPQHVRWATQAENEDDKRGHGTWDTRKSSAKITAEIARQIREDRNTGLTHKQIAELRGTSKAIVTQVLNFRSWRDA
jgi:hypothetical protein